MDCPDVDYLGLPPDLKHHGLVYVMVSDQEYRKPRFLNSVFDKDFVRKYPFDARIVPNRQAARSTNERYQLRIGMISQDYYGYSYSSNAVYSGKQDRFFVIIEDLETGERYAPKTVLLMAPILLKHFLREVDRM